VGVLPLPTESKMLNLVVTPLIIVLVAAVLGFGGIAGAAMGIAKIVFVVALAPRSLVATWSSAMSVYRLA
jgi:uncharacterized membrane protein YtjA (UPF0391 family)